MTKRIGQVDRRRFAVDLPNSVTCGNWNETLKYPGRFHRDTERYFRKESFSPNLIDNQSSLKITKFQSKSNITTHWYHSSTTSWHPIQRLWVRISVTIGKNYTSAQKYFGFFKSKLHICKKFMWKVPVQTFLFLEGFDLWTFMIPH